MIIPDNIAYDINISPSARIMYGFFLDGVECEFTTRELMVFFQVSRGCITGWLRELESKGLIIWERGNRGNPANIIDIDEVRELEINSAL